MDGTLTATTIVEPLVFIRRRMMPPPWREAWLASLLPRGLYWFVLDQFDRAASNRALYASYGGLNADAARALAEPYHQRCWARKVFPEGRARLEQLKSEGVRPVFVTGSLDFLVAPLARELGAECIAARLEANGERFSGRLDGEPLAGEEKAKRVREHASAGGISLPESYAFGDAIGDLPMLECVGHPVAVNPGRRLKTVARRRGWPIERWRL